MEQNKIRIWYGAFKYYDFSPRDLINLSKTLDKIWVSFKKDFLFIQDIETKIKYIYWKDPNDKFGIKDHFRNIFKSQYDKVIFGFAGYKIIYCSTTEKVLSRTELRKWGMMKLSDYENDNIRLYFKE